MPKKDGLVAEALRQQTQQVLMLKGQFHKIIEEEGDQAENFTSALIEGQTDFVEVITGISAHILHLEAQANGIDALASKFKDSSSRRKETAKALRAMLAVALESAGEKRAGPVTLTPVKPKAVVTDETLIPDEYWKTPDPKLDQAKLNRDILEPGRVIPGVVKGNGSNTIRITT